MDDANSPLFYELLKLGTTVQTAVLMATDIYAVNRIGECHRLPHYPRRLDPFSRWPPVATQITDLSCAEILFIRNQFVAE